MGTRDQQNLGYGARIARLSEAKSNTPAVIPTKSGSQQNTTLATEPRTIGLSSEAALLTGTPVSVEALFKDGPGIRSALSWSWLSLSLNTGHNILCELSLQLVFFLNRLECGDLPIQFLRLQPPEASVITCVHG